MNVDNRGYVNIQAAEVRAEMNDDSGDFFTGSGEYILIRRRIERERNDSEDLYSWFVVNQFLLSVTSH